MSATRDPHGRVVLAVDGSEAGCAAASYAATLAARAGAALDVVHVLPAHTPIGPFHPIGTALMETDEDCKRFGQEVLQQALRLARETAPEVAIHTELLSGGRVHQITLFAERARLIVVGRREPSRLDQLWTGGTITGVASRASCPVVVAPAGWEPDPDAPRVVVGFKTPNHAPELLATAFAAAQECHAELQLVHAWKLQSGYDDIVAHRVSEASINREQKDLIWQALTPFRDSYPNTRVRIDVTHEAPVHALVRASYGAERVVVVRPPHGAFVHHLGRTARGLLRESRCPVEVVPAAKASASAMPPLVLGEAATRPLERPGAGRPVGT